MHYYTRILLPYQTVLLSVVIVGNSINPINRYVPGKGAYNTAPKMWEVMPECTQGQPYGYVSKNFFLPSLLCLPMFFLYQLMELQPMLLMVGAVISL